MSRAWPGLPKDAPTAGERFPWMRLELEPNGPVEDLFEHLDDTTFNLLVIGQPVDREPLGEFGDLLRIHAIAADPANAAELTRVKVPQTSFYLLRPDGHVGLCGTRLEVAEVNRYLAEQVHLTTPRTRSNGERLATESSSRATVTPIRKIKPAA
jgi:hypothetical protein